MIRWEAISNLSCKMTHLRQKTTNPLQCVYNTACAHSYHGYLKYKYSGFFSIRGVVLVVGSKKKISYIRIKQLK